MVVETQSEVWMNGTGGFLPRVQGPKCGVQFFCRTNSSGFSMVTSLQRSNLVQYKGGGGLDRSIQVSLRIYFPSSKDDPDIELILLF